jgi:hypothetical protein
MKVLVHYEFFIVIAAVGHTEKHAPHPEQLSVLITGIEMPPNLGGIIIARASQGS